MSGGAYYYAYSKLEVVSDIIKEVEEESDEQKPCLLELADHLTLLRDLVRFNLTMIKIRNSNFIKDYIE